VVLGAKMKMMKTVMKQKECGTITSHDLKSKHLGVKFIALYHEYGYHGD